MESLFYYLIAANIIGIIMMAMDKRKAKKNLWRIPEKTLFITAAIGGSLGILSGMYMFRHKTQKKVFVWGVPVIIILQVTAAVTFYILTNNNQIFS